MRLNCNFLKVLFVVTILTLVSCSDNYKQRRIYTENLELILQYPESFREMDAHRWNELLINLEAQNSDRNVDLSLFYGATTQLVIQHSELDYFFITTQSRKQFSKLEKTFKEVNRLINEENYTMVNFIFPDVVFDSISATINVNGYDFFSYRVKASWYGFIQYAEILRAEVDKSVLTTGIFYQDTLFGNQMREAFVSSKIRSR